MEVYNFLIRESNENHGTSILASDEADCFLLLKGGKLSLTSKKRNIGIPYPLIFIFFLTVLVCLSTPYDWVGKLPLSDSTIFLYIGKTIKNGGCLYQSAFDHKGPLIFTLNFLGLLLNEKFGVWILGFVSVFLFYLFAYKTSRLISNKASSVITLFLLTPVLLGSIDYGNYTEEYALPFITYALYIFIQYFLNRESVKSYEIVLSGVCCSAVFLLRANMVSVWVCFCIAIFLKLLTEKEWKPLLRLCVQFLVGFIAFLLPFVLYFLAKGCLNEAIFQSLIFNFEYSGTSSIGKRDIINWAFDFMSKYMIIFMFLVYFGLILFKNRSHYLLHFTIVVYTALSLCCICLSRRYYVHYFMTLIPCLIFPISYILKDVWNDVKEYNLNKKARICGIVFLTLSFFILNYNVVLNYINVCDFTLSPTSPTAYSRVADIIKSNSSESDLIYAHRLNGCIYLESGRASATKYFSLPAVNLDGFPKIHDEFLSQINANKPKFIVIDNQFFDKDEKIDQELWQIVINHYHKTNTIDGVDLYEINQ